MQPRPAIAILTPGILTALGLKSILEKLIPMAEVDAFDDARALEESGMERYFHFFVATHCFVGHSALFAPVRKRVILLTSGQPQPEFAGFRCLDILRPEGDLIRDIMRMHHGAHHGDHTEGIPPQPQTAQLSAREAEVLALVAQGCLNKEIAQRLHIGLTTVISHRRNLTEKLGIRSVSGLTIYAVTMGYVDPEQI